MTIDVVIHKMSKGVYGAVIQERDNGLEDCPTYESIAHAIKESALGISENFPQYMNVFYAGMWSGTYPLNELAEKADSVADRLVELVAHSKQGW